MEPTDGKEERSGGLFTAEGREALLSRPGLERGEGRVLVRIQQTEYQVKSL